MSTRPQMLLLVILVSCGVASVEGGPPADITPTAPSKNGTTLLSPLNGRRFPAHFRFNIPKDEVFFDTKVIPEDHQVSTFLYKGEMKLFFFLNERDSSTLMISLTPCSSSVEWSVRFRPQNLTGILDDGASVAGEEEMASFNGSQHNTFRETKAKRGLYVVRAKPLERETYVHFYASRSEPLHEHSPQLLEPGSRLKVTTRQHRKKLNMRWEPSTVDPHLMHYCLVVNTRQDYTALCSAQGDKFGVSPPEYPVRAGFNFPRDRQESQKSELASKAARRQASSHQPRFDDIEISCVGKKTHFALEGLQHGKVYYINLFAINKKTNLSFPYASTTVKYDKKPPKPSGIRDGKIMAVNFRQLDGLATFKFKVGSGVSESQFFVLPCGGSVFAEVLLGRQTVLNKTRVDGYSRLRLKNPVAGRYVLRITATDPEELRKIEALQVMGSSRDNLPWPELPSPPVLHEYRSLRSCDSITVGWLPSPDVLATRHCLFVRDLSRPKEPFYKKPNQCLLQEGAKIKRDDLPLVTSVCFDMPYIQKRKVLTQRVIKLRPGRKYSIQLILRRPRGPALSYDLLYTSTKTACSA